jgi:hypothetical protein
MAAHALSNSAETAPRLAVGRVSDEIYASLLGGGPRVLKKKPVLMLAPEELAKAHLAIAMGGAQIMESADDSVAVARPRTPSLLLGLAPVDAPEDWQPGFTTLAQPDAGWEPTPVDELPLAAEEPPLDDWAEPATPPDAWPEDDWAPEPAPEPAQDGAAAPDFPSIEEQLARMRHLTQRSDAPPAAPSTEPVAQFAPVPEPAPEPEFFAPVFAEPEPEPAPEPEAEVFDLPLAAALPPAPEPEQEPQPEPAAVDEWDDDGPDLSWMQPKERRPMVFSESSQSALRAKLVHLDVEPDEDFAAPSLWDRVRGWWARLLG